MIDKAFNPVVGVIIVTYCSSEVILQCLESVLSSDYRDLKIVVCDNASTDDTVGRIREWANGRLPLTWPDNTPVAPPKTVAKPISFGEVSTTGASTISFASPRDVTLVRSAQNRGYAGGVNIGLEILKQDPDVGLFWVLNPDTVVETGAASAYVAAARSAGRLGLMGGRTIYYEHPDRIQSDGGRVNAWTGICANVNLGVATYAAKEPDPTTFDYISGSNLVASREFLEQAGMMSEDYFLYYEEVDWAQRRGPLPLVYASQAIVYHYGGTSIGSPTLWSGASPFSNYFNYRNRMRFMKRYHRARLPIAYVYSLLKVLRLLMIGAWREAEAAARGLHAMPPPKSVRERLALQTVAHARDDAH